jgi:multidrug efflux system membrane fusion protein
MVSGTNLRVIPEANMSSRMLTVIADIEDPENRFVPGLSVSADLPVGSDTPRLAIPSDAVVTTYSGPAVFRATSGEGDLPTAESLPIKVLFQQGGIVFIESEAIEEGDLIVTKGNERLFPGTPLVTKRADAESPHSPPGKAVAGESEADSNNL